MPSVAVTVNEYAARAGNPVMTQDVAPVVQLWPLSALAV